MEVDKGNLSLTQPAKKTSPAKQSPVTPPSQQRSWLSSFWFLGIVVLGGSIGVIAMITQFDGDSKAELIDYEVIGTYPHDTRAFTQGFVYSDGALFESTGRYGESSFRKIEIESGKLLHRLDLPANIFAEGLCRWEGEWLQLTWKAEKILHYDAQTLEPTRESTWSRQGWGLTHDGEQLIISDGTSRLFFVDPTNNEIDRSVDVTEAGSKVDRINELEFINGFLYANVWYKPYVLKIEPKSGKVVGRLDFTDQIKAMNLGDRDAVMNGIAYDPKSKHLWLTGKLWPKVFEIKLKEDP